MSESIRIISLVPSLTELVGRTAYCVHPADQLEHVPVVGGTKNPRLEQIKALRPSHLILNREENLKAVYDQAAAFVPNIIVTHPVTLDDNRDLLAQFGDEFDRANVAKRLVGEFDAARARLLSRKYIPLRVLYLIWRKPWMSVASETFISEMLAAVGLQAVHHHAVTDDASRYPVLEPAAFADLRADLVLCSSEPYPFGDKHMTEIQSLPGMAGVACRLVDGEMTSWYGSRAISGLDYLGQFRDAIDQDTKRIQDGC